MEVSKEKMHMSFQTLEIVCMSFLEASLKKLKNVYYYCFLKMPFQIMCCKFLFVIVMAFTVTSMLLATAINQY